MLHELRIAAAIVVFFAATAVPASPQPRTSGSAITEALCGGDNNESARARAVDEFDLAAVPDVWRNASVEELQLWSAASGCGEEALEESARQFNRRTRKLRQILARLDQAKRIDSVRQSLLVLVKRRPRSDAWSKPATWPSAAECDGCAALRRAGVVAVRAAAQCGERTARTTIGARLDALREDEMLVVELCAAKPSAAAAAEMVRRFRYYTWTADGAWLLAVAQWFEELHRTGRCAR